MLAVVLLAALPLCASESPCATVAFRCSSRSGWGREPSLTAYPLTRGAVVLPCPEAVAEQRKIAHGFVVDAARIGGGLMADLWSTEYALARRPDLRESNPLGVSKNARMWLKGAMAGVVIWICDRLRRDGHEGWATWLGRGAFVLQLGAATSNVVKAHR